MGRRCAVVRSAQCRTACWLARHEQARTAPAVMGSGASGRSAPHPSAQSRRPSVTSGISRSGAPLVEPRLERQIVDETTAPGLLAVSSARSLASVSETPAWLGVELRVGLRWRTGCHRAAMRPATRNARSSAAGPWAPAVCSVRENPFSRSKVLRR